MFKTFLRKWNDRPIFNPSLWPQRELLAKVAGSAVCLVFMAHRIFRFNRYTGKVPPFLKQFSGIFERSAGSHFTITDWHWLMWFSVWIIETGILAGYIMAFISRTEAKSVAKGFMEVIFPVIIAALPLLIVLAPMNFNEIWPPLIIFLSGLLTNVSSNFWLSFLWQSWEPVFFLFLAIITIGGTLNLIGLLTLRKAFTITSEARLLIRRGLFSIVRHPLYAGHFLMFFGYLLFHLHWYTVVLYLVFIAGQYKRARIEESKLMAVFPEYPDYLKSTGMFFPKILSNKPGSKVHGSRLNKIEDGIQ